MLLLIPSIEEGSIEEGGPFHSHKTLLFVGTMAGYFASVQVRQMQMGNGGQRL
jgi:hypothetical protein